MNDPDHPLAEKLDSIPRFSGQKNSTEELESLANQAKELGELLNEWNSSMQESTTTEKTGKQLVALIVDEGSQLNAKSSSLIDSTASIGGKSQLSKSHNWEEINWPVRRSYE